MKKSMVSKGEQKVARLFQENNILFKREVTFSDLKDRDFLRFDFAIFDKETYKLVALVEFDGEGHFKNIKNWGGFSNFDTQREHDRMKNIYCLNKKIPLIRIPYWDYDLFTIEDILYSDKYLVKDKYHNDNLIMKKL